MQFSQQQNSAHQQQRLTALPVWRRRVLLLGLLIGFMVLVGQSIYLQSTKRNFCRSRVEIAIFAHCLYKLTEEKLPIETRDFGR